MLRSGKGEAAPRGLEHFSLLFMWNQPDPFRECKLTERQWFWTVIWTWRSKGWCVTFACANWLIAVCHSDLIDILILMPLGAFCFEDVPLVKLPCIYSHARWTHCRLLRSFVVVSLVCGALLFPFLCGFFEQRPRFKQLKSFKSFLKVYRYKLMSCPPLLQQNKCNCWWMPL